MSNQIGMGGFRILPEGVKNLLILNVLAFLATAVFSQTGLCDLSQWLGLHYFSAPDFYPWQIVTYMFMHANFSHLFFNMFALWMFGAAVENLWGTRRFMVYYFITGIGAALVHYIVIAFQVHPTVALVNQFLDAPSLASFRFLVEHNQNVRFSTMLTNNLAVLQQNPGALDDIVAITADAKDMFLNSYNIIGASGAVFGILLAFGMMFPDSEIYIYFLLPIKAKWFVVIYGVIELFAGVSGRLDDVAHFAHLGGMVFGLILILIWRRRARRSRFRDDGYTDYEEL